MAYLAYRINTQQDLMQDKGTCSVAALMVKVYYTLIPIKLLKQTSITAVNTGIDKPIEVYDKLDWKLSNDTPLTTRTSLKADDTTKPEKQFIATSL